MARSRGELMLQSVRVCASPELWTRRASRVGGTSRPIVFAVLRLMNNSNLFGCCTGKSPGLALSAALVHGRHEAHTHRTTAWLSQTRRAMTWVLFTMLLCAVGPTQASAQKISQQLLELDEDQRNAAFTRMLWDTERKCDHVIRTLFNGTVLGVDDWEVLCHDRRSYSISVLVELELHDTIITSLSCRELSATSKGLLHKAGSNGQATGCKIR
jgi:hypothetical protein